MMSLTEIEEELEERQIALREKWPVVDNRGFLERGRWLRQEQMMFSSLIHSGELWTGVAVTKNHGVGGNRS